MWELTLRCDQACLHCGSRAGAARPDELTREEALDVVRQLAAMRVREVVLMGGEAYLHAGFEDVIAALREAGIRPVMTTGGRGITPELASRMKAAGLAGVSVSIDGREAAHDRVRGFAGSFASATAALGRLRDAGIAVYANTNVNRLSRDDLEGVYEHLKAHGVRSWQVQITVPLGRTADRPALVLQPWDLLDVVPRIVALKRRALAEGILLMPGNNLGYFGPEESILRSLDERGEDHWAGCQAGRFVLGIQSNGDIKGCASLQSAVYVGGNVRQTTIARIWDESAQLAFNRQPTSSELWGFCGTCPFGETCRAGCTFTSHALFGRPGNNPYCHFRARTLARGGKRERLVQVRAPEGRPFDHGLFEIVVEELEAPDPAATLATEDLVRPRRLRPAAL